MASVPKESDDVKKSIIRTTIKNENLLARKMEIEKIKKRGNKKKTSTLKHRIDRTDKVAGVLSTKIQQSVERARFVQNARKAGWDQINRTIVIKNDLVEKAANAAAGKDAEEEEEDEFVKQFFETKDDTKTQPSKLLTGNVFAMLEEAEA